MEKNGFIRSIY